MPIVVGGEQYELQTLLGANDLCHRYVAASAGGELVEVRILREQLGGEFRERMIKRLRIAALFRDASAVAMRGLELTDELAAVVVDRPVRPTLEEWPADAEVGEILRGASRFAAGLANAHRLGLVHGELSPATIRGGSLTAWRSDFTGLASDRGTGTAERDDAERNEAARFHSPERRAGADADEAGDVYSLGAVVEYLLERRFACHPESLDATGEAILTSLRRRLLGPDGATPPTAGQFAMQLECLAESSAVGSSAVGSSAVGSSAVGSIAAASTSAPSPLAIATAATLLAPSGPGDTGLFQVAPRQLGRFQLLESLGEGAMGAVYRARDSADGSIVAVKILRPRLRDDGELRRRLAKEARLLAQANNPYVANLLEFQSEDQEWFMAVEFVPGGTVGQELQRRERLSEPVAVRLLADAARGLSVAHDRGIVHRDIKPDNLLLTAAGRACLDTFPADRAARGVADNDVVQSWSQPLVKLSDFGLARSAQQSESLAMTQEGTLLGTPLYMSPEQGRGEPACAASDVYAFGATLFHLLAGRPPFVGDSAVAVIRQHCQDPPPSLRTLCRDVSEATIRVVEKCLAKSPVGRYPDAGELLIDLERLVRGEPTTLRVHPPLPGSGEEGLEFSFTCLLDASPAQLWPHVSNTDRVNHALGLPSVRYSTRVDPRGRVERFGETKIAGQAIRWQEHPYEWVEGRRMSVLREFTRGPFVWFTNVVELSPRGGGGTQLTQTFRVAPRNFLGKLLAWWGPGRRTPRAFARTYEQIDQYLTSQQGRMPSADPFGAAQSLRGARLAQLERRVERLRDQGVSPDITDVLGQFLAHASDVEVARIRPLPFAERFGLDPQGVVEACLRGVQEGILTLLWDLLCPSCRIPADVRETLAALQSHGYCPACDLKFELDFSQSVEMIFRAHPELRAVDTRTYCIGGPAFSAHVVAQSIVAPGERLAVALELEEGIYRVRGPQLPFQVELRVSPTDAVRRYELALSRPPPAGSAPRLASGSQCVTLNNDTGQPLQVRIERTAGRALAVTAADAARHPLFRAMFPDQVLSAGRVVSVGTVTLLAARVAHAARLYHQLGDGPAFGEIQRILDPVRQCLEQGQGAIVKEIEHGCLATFAEPTNAVRAALAWFKRPESAVEPIQFAIHRGPALMATVQTQLEYFGATINELAELTRLAETGEILLSDQVAREADASRLVQDTPIACSMVSAAELDNEVLAELGAIHRWRRAVHQAQRLP